MACRLHRRPQGDAHRLGGIVGASDDEGPYICWDPDTGQALVSDFLVGDECVSVREFASEQEITDATVDGVVDVNLLLERIQEDEGGRL